MSSAAAGDFLGTQEQPFWRDHQLFRVNTIRTKTLIERTALMIVRFGDKYEQWSAAFDAGYGAALGKPCVTLHAEGSVHPLKEVDAAMTCAATTAQG